MKLSDLVPSRVTLDGLRGVETELQSRRYASNWSLAVAIVAAAFKIAQLIQSDVTLSAALGRLRDALLHPRHFTWHGFLDALTTGQTIPLLIAFLAAGTWVMLRYTGVLFKQSQRPFRYTFSIEDFTLVKDTPGPRFSVQGLDQMNLLTSDLIERLKRRVQRFSLLEKPGADGTAPIAKGLNATSHFHIKAEYAIRKDESDNWIVHVWPRVRIGAEGNAFTLASPVRLPFVDGSDPGESEIQGVLNIEEYQRLVERVYSSIATEIYKQIEIDLRDKMTLFPTLSLRALARYVEADDFETSNTIDAYNRALDMYQTSLEELKASFLHKCKRFLRVRSALEAEAKTKLGYSRCKIYRRLVSEMAARDRNPIFDSKANLKSAIDLLGIAYNSFFPIKRWWGLPLRDLPSDSNMLELVGSRNAVRWPLKRKRDYRRVSGELCEALAVDGLAHSLLDDSEMAAKRLKLASTLADSLSGVDCLDRVRLLLFLAKSELEPRLQDKLTALSQAIELNLDSEIALYRHAYYSDLLARDQGCITKERVDYLCGKYEEVLRANPGNIASLIGQGYLLWLVDELQEARKKLLAGIELEKIVKQTFVGDLKYCLARVEVERAYNQIVSCQQAVSADQALTESPRKRRERLTDALLSLKTVIFPYEEATVADPLVAASYVDEESKARNSNFNRINREILNRYEIFVKRTRHIVAVAKKSELDLGRTPAILLSYALNDCGNAWLNYFVRFEYSTGKDEALQKSLALLAEAVSLNPDQLMMEHNLFLANSWRDDLPTADVQKLFDSIDTLPFSAQVSVVNQAIRQGSVVLMDVPIDQEEPETRRYREKIREQIKSLDEKIRSLEADIKAGIKEAQNRSSAQAALPEPVSAAIASGEASNIAATSSSSAQRIPAEATEKTGSKARNTLSPAGETAPVPVAEPKLKNPLTTKLNDLRQSKARRERILQFDSLEEPIRKFAANYTALAPFADRLRYNQAKYLVEALGAARSELGDNEVYVLSSMAQIWSNRPDADEKAGSQLLCSYLLEKYRPEDFSLNWAALQTASEEGIAAGEKRAQKKDQYHRLLRAVDWSLKSDPQSSRIKDWAYVLCAYEAARLQKEKKYQEAIKRLEREQTHCGDLPAFHDRLAVAYEEAEGAGASVDVGRTPANSRILAGRRRAWELDPTNNDYRDKLLTALGRRSISKDTLHDPLKQRVDSMLIEVEVSSESKSDIGLTDESLTPQLQKRIDDLRASLKENLGFTLPGVSFRDNRVLAKGQFRVLTHGVPSPFQSLPESVGEASQYLTKRLGAEARRKAAELFSSQDCYWKLNDLAKIESGVSGIQNNPQLLAALTWVLKALLMEGTPIVDLGPIVASFRDCQSRGLGLIRTVEEIRGLPEIRKRLRGNSVDEAAWITRLPPDLDRRLEQSISFQASEPIFRGAAPLRQEVWAIGRDAALSAADGFGVMLTSTAVRPIVWKMVSPLEVAVLSYREIFPSLLSRLKEPNAVTTKAIQAPSGN